MSSTEEATQPQAIELAALSIDQLKQLKTEQTDETAAALLQDVIDEREKLESLTAAGKTEKATKAKGPRPSRKGTRAPRGRQVTAAATFNADQANLDRLQGIMEYADDPVVVKDDQGNITGYRMTPRLIQAAISAYYDERRRETSDSPKAEKGSDPIIPAATPAATTDPSATSETNVEEPVSEPVAEALVEEATEALPDDEVDDAPQATAGPPFNPYGPDESTNE